jgi:Leucine-rich repeat (LRR) protein
MLTTQFLLTSFINDITLSNRTVVNNGPTPEDQALNYLIVNDTTFNFSQLLELNSMMTNIVQFRIRQRYALLTLWFQQAFTNTSWRRSDEWLEYAYECDSIWFGISCESIDLGGTLGSQDAVTSVIMHHNNIQGSIPADLGLLTALTRFDVSYNRLTGTLPASIGQCTTLTVFNVQGNELTGTLPASIGQWTALTFFNVHGNELTGTLPASIGQWTALTTFYVSENALTGTLPASIGQWTALKIFDVSGNALTGTIPASISNWSQIYAAFFFSNQFTGTMPDGICGYINPTIGKELQADCVSEIACPLFTCCTGCY